jgi:sec-independent protein translocase protein TatB
MLDLGWQEFVVVGIVLVLVVGPKDMPRVLKAAVKTVGKMRGMAREFQTSMMEIADQDEFRDVKKTLDDIRTGKIEALDELEKVKDGVNKNYVPGFSSEVNEIKSATEELKSEVDAAKADASQLAAAEAKPKPAKKTSKKSAKKSS